MIQLYLSDKLCGFVSIVDENSEVIYGETCNLDRLFELLTVTPYTESLVVYASKETYVTLLSETKESSHFKIKDVIIDSKLDVYKRLCNLKHISTSRKQIKKDFGLLFGCIFLIGSLAALLMCIPVAQSYFEIRQGVAKKSLENLTRIETLSEKCIDGTGLLKEINFYYNPQEINSFTIEEENKFTVIFFSEKSGLKTVDLPSVKESKLTESSAISTEDGVFYFYTLEGKLK